MASEYRFLPLFFSNLGCSESQIGALMSITPIAGIFFTPVWTWFADVHSSRRSVLLWSCAVCLIIFPLNPLVELVSKPGNKSNGLVFGLLMLLRVVYSSLAASQGPLIDALTLESLGPHKVMFGKQRSWGAIGWGVAYLLLGFATDAIGLSWMFVQFVLSGILLIAVIKGSNLGKKGLGEGLSDSAGASDGHAGKAVLGCEEKKQHEKQPSISSVLRLPFMNINTFAFFVLTFIWGAGMAIVENFLFLFLTENFQVSNTLCGIAVTVTVLPEIPIFTFAEIFLDRMGPFAMIVVAQLCFVVRAFAYSTISTPWLVLFFELLHGVTFGLHHIAAVHLIAKLGPESMTASLQGLYNMVAFGLGTSASVIVGGVMIEKFGDRKVFLWYAIVTLVFTALYCVVECVWGGRRHEGVRKQKREIVSQPL